MNKPNVHDGLSYIYLAIDHILYLECPFVKLILNPYFTFDKEKTVQKKKQNNNFLGVTFRFIYLFIYKKGKRIYNKNI